MANSRDHGEMDGMQLEGQLSTGPANENAQGTAIY
jgi:hypothetical protein